MARLTFYEKPGCVNNTKQKNWLLAAGHELEVVDILTHPWTPETLRPFFGDKPVAQWINRTAPAVKSGEVVPEALGADEALVLMTKNPLLIKRPLIVSGGRSVSGFDVELIDRWLGLTAKAGEEKTVEALKSENLTTCPMIPTQKSCDDQID